MSRFGILFIILIEGFVTISAEILSIRQLLPVVGNSVIVTSLIIGFFLLFLAYGYRRGGQHQAHHISILKENFTKSAFWLGIGLSYFFISVFFYLFNKYISHQQLLALTVYLLIIISPLVYLLGQTIPITMNLLKETKTMGEMGGNVLHLSTLGSFLGAIVTSLLFINYFGVAWTVFINFCLLIILTLMLFSDKFKDGMRFISLGIGLVIVYLFNISWEKDKFVVANTYGNYAVITDKNIKRLLINETQSSALDVDKKAFPYIEWIKHILFVDLALKGKAILVLGAGGFSLSAENDYGNDFTYVDIDKDIFDIIQKNFADKINGRFISEDARQYLKHTTQYFDVIVSDVYSNLQSIPPHLVTREYYEEIKVRLKSSGLAIINIMARPTLKDDYSKHMDNTIRSVFNQCMVIPIQYIAKTSNILYVCQKDQSHPRNIYTDDKNLITFDFFKFIQEKL